MSSFLDILYVIFSVSDIVEAHVSCNLLVSLSSCCSFLHRLCYEDDRLWKVLCRRDFHWYLFADTVHSCQIYQNLFANHGAFKLCAPEYLQPTCLAWSPDNRRFSAASTLFCAKTCRARGAGREKLTFSQLLATFTFGRCPCHDLPLPTSGVRMQLRI